MNKWLSHPEMKLKREQRIKQRINLGYLFKIFMLFIDFSRRSFKKTHI